METRKLKLISAFMASAALSCIANPVFAAKPINTTSSVDLRPSSQESDKDNRYNNIVINTDYGYTTGINYYDIGPKTVYLTWRPKKDGIKLNINNSSTINASLLDNSGPLTVNGLFNGTLTAKTSSKDQFALNAANGISNTGSLSISKVGHISIDSNIDSVGIENKHETDDGGRYVIPIKDPNKTAINIGSIGSIKVNADDSTGIFNHDAFFTTKNISAINTNGVSSAIGIDNDSRNISSTIKINDVGSINASIDNTSNPPNDYSDSAIGIRNNAFDAGKISIQHIGSIKVNAAGKNIDAYGIYSSSSFFDSRDDEGDEGVYYFAKPKTTPIIINIDSIDNLTASATGTNAAAYGIYANKSSVKIKSAKIAVKLGANAWSLYADKKGKINIGGGSGPVQITGNIKANANSHIAITMKSADDFYCGRVDDGNNAGKILFDLGNGGTIEPFFQPGKNTENLPADINGTGIIDLTWDHKERILPRHLDIKSLNGNNDILRISTDLANNRGDSLSIGKASKAQKAYIQVINDPFFLTGTTTKSISGRYTVITSSPTKKDGHSSYTMQFLPMAADIGAYRVTPKIIENKDTDGSWDIVSLTGIGNSTPTPIPAPKPSDNTTSAALVKVDIGNTLFFLNQSLSQRLGELHLGDRTDNFYLRRQQVGDAKYNSCTFSDNIVQIGYDKAQKLKDGTAYNGMAIDKVTEYSNFNMGSSDTNGGDLALYHTYADSNGCYYDLVLRKAHLKTNYCVTDLSGTFSTASIHTNAVSASAEYGRRLNLGHGNYIEPQAQLTYSRVSSGNYLTSTGYKVYSGDYGRAISRLGFAYGHIDNRTSYYSRLDFFHNFSDDGGIRFDTLDYGYRPAKNWEKITIGANAKLSKNCRSYIELSKYFGGIKSTKLSWNFGLRFMF